MYDRRSLKWPITLGVTMIVLLVALTVGWVLLTARDSPLYWTLLAVGTTFLMLVLVGVVMYLALSVKAINLNRRQSNFIDSVTHELKSPIASLKLYLQTLNRRQVDPQEQQSFYRIMLEDVDRLDQLINHLLDAARLERTPLEGELEDIRLDGLLDECAAAVAMQYQTPPDAIQIAAEPCLIRARRVDLEMIFRNLIDNAVKYGGADPQVDVRVEVTSDGVITRIGDNGRGVPHQLRRKIFGRFVRLGMELERKKPGTGLGLYIVRTLVRRLRGQISVRDREQGSGSVFEVQLPGRRGDADGSETGQPERPQAEVA